MSQPTTPRTSPELDAALTRIAIIDSPRPEDAGEDRVLVRAFRDTLAAIDRAVSRVIPRPGCPSHFTLPEAVDEMADRLTVPESQARADALDIKIAVGLVEDERILPPNIRYGIEEAVNRLDGLLTDTRMEIGTARTGQLQPVLRLIRSLEDQGWVPRSKAGTWPAKCDEPPVDREALVALHEHLLSDLQETDRMADPGFVRIGRAEISRDVLDVLAAALDLEE